MKVIYNPVNKRFSIEKTVKPKLFTFSRLFGKGGNYNHSSRYREYPDESYDDESYKRYEDLDAFNNLVNKFIKEKEVDLYKAYKFIKDGNLKSDVSKICHLMALQAAAEGMNTHRLVERIMNDNGRSYWVDWLKGKLESHGLVSSGRHYNPMTALQDYIKGVGTRVDFDTNIANFKRSVDDSEVMGMLSQDYPNDYQNDSYQDDSYQDESYRRVSNR